jgi:hypothetical protein
MNIFSPKNMKIIIIAIVAIVALVLIVSGYTYTTAIMDTNSPEGRYKVDITGEVHSKVTWVFPVEFRTAYTQVDFEFQEVEDIDFFDIGPFWFWETADVSIRAILKEGDDIIADDNQNLGSFSTVINGKKDYDLHLKNVPPTEDFYTLYLEIREGSELKFEGTWGDLELPPKVS